MYSFGFPKMLNHATTNLVKDNDAIRSNVRLLLSSEQNTLFGDPYFGSLVKTYMYEQANTIVCDLLIDSLYTSLVTFMPHIYLTRKDIKVYCQKANVFAEVKYITKKDNTADLFIIKLTDFVDEN